MKGQMGHPIVLKLDTNRFFNSIFNFRRIDNDDIRVGGREFESYLLYIYLSFNVKNLTSFALFTNRKFRPSHE